MSSDSDSDSVSKTSDNDSSSHSEDDSDSDDGFVKLPKTKKNQVSGLNPPIQGDAADTGDDGDDNMFNKKEQDFNNKKKRKAKEDGIYQLLSSSHKDEHGAAEAIDNNDGAEFADLTLLCRDCEAGFVFSAEEQAFHAEKGFEHQPVRCKDCRLAKKERMAEHEAGGGGDGKRSGDNRGFGNRAGFAGRKVRNYEVHFILLVLVR